MAGIWETIREFLAKFFGGGNDTQRRLKALDGMEDKFVAARRDNEDNLHSLKDEIKTLEARALQKKRELDQAHGDSKRIVVGEIERIFRELNGLRERENIIAASLERIRAAVLKVRAGKDALRAGIKEGQLDDIALELQDIFGELKRLDREKEQLEQERYEAPVAGKVDVDQRMAEVQGAEKAPVALSAETEKRLKQLETE